MIETETDTELTQRTITCCNCGKEHTYKAVMFRGREPFPRRHCEACNNAEHERWRQKQQRVEIEEEQRHRRALWERICPPLYRKTEPTRLPQESLNKVMAWEYGPQGLLAYGPSGKGKTRAIYLLLHKQNQGGREIEAFWPGRFAHECTRRFSNDGDGPDWIERLMRVDVLFMDDFGKDRLTERAEAELFALIEGRIAQCKPILTTMNFGADDLAAKLSDDRGEPLVRRLREFCDAIKF